MGYLGYKPADKPLTSADITDGIVSIADLSATGTPSSSNFLRGDGTWNAPQAGFSGATTTSSAVDITLTSASTQVQNITMTASDKAVILPDATTLTTKGTPIYQIKNSGTKSFLIKLNSGYVLTKLQYGTSILLTLIDNATTDGTWSNTNLGITSTAIGSLGVGSMAGTLLYSPFTTVKTGTTGTPAFCSNYGQFNNSITTSKISTSSAIICYHSGTSNRDIYGVVVSYSGSTITVNSETLLYSGTTTASTSSQGIMLSATNGLLFVTRASDNVVVPFTISGTTISVGTASSTFGTGTGTSSNARQLGQAIAMDSTTALVPDRNSTSTATWTLRTIIHNGASAPTIGTASSAITTNSLHLNPVLSKIDSTNAFACYQVVTTNYTVARVITISGASAPTLQTANTSSTSFIAGGILPSKISSTEFIVIGVLSMENYTVSGTTVTYVGNSNYANLPDGYIDNDATNFAFSFNSGQNMYAVGRFNIVRGIAGGNTANSTFWVFKKVGNFYELSNSGILEKSIFTSQPFNETGSIYAVDMVELDTNIILLVTNNSGTTTITASILKYVGA